jgi:hypothetical protein
MVIKLQLLLKWLGARNEYVKIVTMKFGVLWRDIEIDISLCRDLISNINFSYFKY